MAKLKKAVASRSKKVARLQGSLLALVVISACTIACTFAEMRTVGQPTMGVLTPIRVEIPESTADSYKQLSAVELEYGARAQVMEESIRKVVAEIPAIADRKEEIFDIVGDVENFHTSVDGYLVKGFLGESANCEGAVYLNVYSPEQICVGGFVVEVFFTDLPIDLASGVSN